FKVGDTTWKCDLASYDCSRTEAKPAAPEPAASAPEREEESSADEGSPEPQPQPGQRRGPPQVERSPRSPDGKWTAFVKDHNVFVRARDGCEEIALSQDGKEGLAYGMLQWSPDSKTLVAFRTEPGDRKEVYLIELSPKGGGRAKLHTRPYALPGDKFSAHELNVFEVASQKQTK